MASSIYRNLVITLIFFGCATLAHSQENNKPLADSELLALVAGNVLSENVVHEIDSRGLAFSAPMTLTVFSSPPLALMPMF